MSRPRVTIGRLMIAVAVVALGLFVVRTGNGAVVVVVALLVSLGVGWLTWRACRRRAGAAGLALVALSSALVGLVVLIDLTWPFLLSVDPIWIFLLVLAGPPIAGAAVALAGSIDSLRGIWRPNLAVAAVVVIPLLAASAVVMNWPFYLLFRLSRPELAVLAQRTEAGQSIAWPVRAGAFTIEGVRVDPTGNGNVLLLTRSNPSGPAGFCRWVDPTVRPLMTPSNIDIPLDGVWHYLDED